MYLTADRQTGMTTAESQLASAVLMIRPARFGSNPMTAASNRFQADADTLPDELQSAAEAEFDRFAETLEANGIRAVVVPDLADPETPDAIFPNNWVSFHADGRVVLYPMEAKNRRLERRLDIIEMLDTDLGYHVSEIVDLSGHEVNGHYLEGTGSMVLDRQHRIAYAGLSTRTHLDPLGDFAQRLDYDVVAFDAVDRNGIPIYHTNVLMNIGESIAVVCDVAIHREEQRAAVLKQLEDTGHDIVHIDYTQLGSFAGNMLELRNDRGERLTVMSKTAFESLHADQMGKLRDNGTIVTADIDCIERAGGGSVRCMLAEIHLPKAA